MPQQSICSPSFKTNLCVQPRGAACARSVAAALVAVTLAFAGPVIAGLVFAGLASAAPAGAQERSSNGTAFRQLANHVPAWATEERSLGAVAPEERMGGLTLVLQRDAARQRAFEKLLADQQDAASPEFHRWLTPEQIGERFGLTDEELERVTGWIESQGLRVEWVSPARNEVNFSGTAGDVSRAFRAELNYYSVDDARRYSVATAPELPADVAPLVKAVRGLSTSDEHPLSKARPARIKPSPRFTNGTFDSVTPGDFAKIYDVPSSLTGSGVTIGIVGEARTDMNDFKYFRQATSTTFPDPTEIVPTAYGGVDPGPALTAPPTGDQSNDDQLEATLDVFRSASIAQKAKVELVVASSASGGIGADIQYLVNTRPLVQVINISFGGCEAKNPGATAFWDNQFSQAAGEGISVFVASGDAAAAGCDPYFSTPAPGAPFAYPISPNFICSSSFDTCLGGTEFADANDNAKYWGSNGTGFESALGYIPEGAWNEPMNGSATTAVGTGGGVSSEIPTPSWQVGTGVPAARKGRYTPDLAFTSSGHDGYFGCMASVQFTGDPPSSCVPDAQGNFEFLILLGTSAAAPDMAGVAALLDQHLGGAGQGNLNPRIYAMAKSAPTAFHDVTVASSGVSGCSVNTPSMCNNSTPGPTGLSGGQAGYLVGTGYDEATGWGSLDVTKFINSYAVAKEPAVVTGATSGVSGNSAIVAGTVNPEGQATMYWFKYSTSSTLTGAAFNTAQTSAGSGTTAEAKSVRLTGLKPLTKYYFEMMASNSAGTATGKIASFTTSKAAQTIKWVKPVNAATVIYGQKIALSAQATSALPVTFAWVSGPAKLVGSALTITGEGTIVIAANQAGNATWLAAPRTLLTIKAVKATLTVTAASKTMTAGQTPPALTYTITGLVNGDTSKAYTGKPVLTTTATSKSTPKQYPITVTIGTLKATNYGFKLVGGTMTVKVAP